jgi:hypothetical protein
MLRRSLLVRLGTIAGATLLLAGCFGDGVHQVGAGKDQVVPGTYSAPGVQKGSYGCYWARLKDFTGSFDGIVDNGLGDARQFMTVAPTDAGVQSSGCGTWEEVTATTRSYNKTPGSAIPDGMSRVGVDVLPGVWQSSGAPGTTCYWARLKDWTGGVDSILGNDIGAGKRLVTILPTDTGFDSSSCGGWTKVG